MGYTESNLHMGTDFYGPKDLAGGLRFTLDVPQGATIERAFLKLYVELMYPAGQRMVDALDDANGTDILSHTMDMGNGWAKAGAGSGYYDVSDEVLIQSNVAIGRSVNSDQAHCRYVSSNVGSDGTIQAKVNYQTAYANARTGILFRHVISYDALGRKNAFYWVFWAEVMSGSHANYYVSRVHEYWALVWDDDLGDWVAIIVYDFTTVASNLYDLWSDWPTFKVVLDESSIKCYVNSVLMFDLLSGNLQTEVQHGLYGYPAGWKESGYFQWNDFDFMPLYPASPNLEVACDDVDDSDDFSVDLPGTRVLTTARVGLGDISGWTAGWNYTVDIREVIQEVVDRVGWVTGNALSVILGPAAENSLGELLLITSYDGNASRGAGLYVNYS